MEDEKKHKNKYDIAYSLGTACGCAIYMKKNNLRICSGPFDWIAESSFESRINLILNDFKDFFNEEDFVPFPKDPKITNDSKFDYYRNIKTGFLYLHDFPANIPIKESFPSVKEKYLRRIDRFYKNIQEKEEVLLIWLAHTFDTPDETIKELTEDVCRKFNKKIDFLIIEHKEGIKVPIKTKINDNVIKYNLHTQIIKDNQPTPIGDEKLIDPIFKQYSLNLPLKTIIKYRLICWLTILICSLIPIKKIRRKIKNKYRKCY